MISYVATSLTYGALCRHQLVPVLASTVAEVHSKYKRRASSHYLSTISTAHQSLLNRTLTPTFQLPTMLAITVVSAILAFTPTALANPVQKRDPGNFRLFEHHYYQRKITSLLLPILPY